MRVVVVRVRDIQDEGVIFIDVRCFFFFFFNPSKRGSLPSPNPPEAPQPTRRSSSRPH